MRLPIFETVLAGSTVTGSIVGTHQDLEEVFALHAPRADPGRARGGRLDDVNDAIEAVLDGSAGTARTVLRMTPAAGAAHDAAPVSAARGSGDAFAAR